MVGTQIRTIFLAIRGANMLGTSVTGPKKQIDELAKSEQGLQVNAYKLMFAGAAFLTFGVFMMRALGGLLDQSSKGATMLDDLGLAWGRFSSRLSASVARTLEWQVKSIIGLLEGLTGNQGAVENMGVLATYTTEAVIALGALAIAAAGISVLSGVVGSIVGGIIGLAFAISPSFTFGLALTAAGILEGITDALMAGLAAAGVLVGGSIALPVTIAIIAAIAGWEFLVPEDTKRGIMEGLGDWWRGVTGANGTGGGAGTRGSTGAVGKGVNYAGAQQNDVTVNIYGNTWDKNVDEATLGTKVGQQVADSFKGTIGVR